VLVALDAVDVAMTEASVGAGISTVLLLAAMHLGRSEEARPLHRPWVPLALSVAVGAFVVYGTLGLPGFSDTRAPIHQHVVPRYLEQAVAETGVPNVVTAVLASYRGYDTLGETTVVFTAGAGVVALLRRRRRARAATAPAEPAASATAVTGATSEITATTATTVAVAEAVAAATASPAQPGAVQGPQ
jgi:multicomponent Na+:H+ antiporter subunit B